MSPKLRPSAVGLHGRRQSEAILPAQGLVAIDAAKGELEVGHRGGIDILAFGRLGQGLGSADKIGGKPFVFRRVTDPPTDLARQEAQFRGIGSEQREFFRGNGFQDSLGQIQLVSHDVRVPHLWLEDVRHRLLGPHQPTGQEDGGSKEDQDA